MSDTTSPNWKTLTNFITRQIGKNWINEYYPEDYTIFITKHSLIQIWSDEDAFDEGSAFTVFKRLFEQPELEKKKFERHSILLISALLYHRWTPDASQQPCKPQNDGLLFTKTNDLFTDDDLTLSSEQNKTIFGKLNVDFSEGQYRFCPAVLHDKNGDGFIRLNKEKRLPFEFMQNEKKRRGWYGEVSRVKIKSSYLKGHISLPISASEFACKTILHSRQDFHTEVRNLETIRHNALSHNHIVTHLIAIDVPPNKFKIVFPWAFTDLADLLRKPHPQLPDWLLPSAFNARNALKEVTLLAGALDFLHRRISSSADNQPIALYHMDLKADNVLVFRPQGPQEAKDHPMGFWKITDFGLSDTKKVRVGDLIDSLETPDRSSDQPLQRRSGPYQAPEIEGKHEFENHAIDHEKADMWSYGTVVAEVLAFSIAGSSSVQEMRNALRHDEDDEDKVSRDLYFYRFAKGKFCLCLELQQFFEQDSANVSLESQSWHQQVWDSVKRFALHVNPGERYTAKQMGIELTRQFDGAPFIQLMPDKDVEIYEDNEKAEGQQRSTEKSPSRRSSSVSTSSMPSVDDPTHTNDEASLHASESSTSPEPRSDGLPEPETQPPDEKQPTLSRDVPSRLPVKCGKMSRKSKSFSDHLALQHFKPDKETFVVTNWNGSEAILSGKSGLIQAHLPNSGGIECAGILPRVGTGRLESYAIRISGSLVIIREASQLHVHQFAGEEVFLNTERLQAEIGGRYVASFNLSANNRICLAFEDSINILDLQTGDSLLRHKKAGSDGNFAATSFDSTGHCLFAVSHDKYVVWRYQESDKQFAKALEVNHGLVSDLQSFSPRLVTTNQPLTCLTQMRVHPDVVYFLGHSFQTTLQLEYEKYRVSSRLCTFSQDSEDFILCIGRRKNMLRLSGPEHILLIWSLSQSSDGKPILGRAVRYDFDVKLQNSASMKTGLCVRPGNNPLAIIVEVTGHIHSIPLKLSRAGDS